MYGGGISDRLSEPAEFEFLPPSSPLRMAYRYAVHGFDLKPDDMVVSFKQVEPLVRSAFSELAGRGIPDNINVFVFPYETLEMFYRKIGGKGKAPAATSFRRDGLDLALVEAGECARIMYGIGHEIGHLSTPTLQDRNKEELKARIFQELWLNELDNPKYNGMGRASRKYLEDAVKSGDTEHVSAEEEILKMMGKSVDLRSAYYELVNPSTKQETSMKSLIQRLFR